MALSYHRRFALLHNTPFLIICVEAGHEPPKDLGFVGFRVCKKVQRTTKIYCSQRLAEIFSHRACTATKVNESGLVSNHYIVYSINDVYTLTVPA